MSGGSMCDPPELRPWVDLAIDDLVERLDISSGLIEVISAAAVTWPDKGLGCPQPGMAYQQVRVDGTLIELGVGGRVYRYHSGGSRAPFLCERTFTGVPLAPVDRIQG